MTQTAVETPLQVLEHEPYLQVTWRDTETPARGFVVIDQLVTGIATGGLRMRPGCTLHEVGELAREMTLKMGAFGIHVGGAKGGIDFDPADPRAEEVRERFLQGVRPLLERFWVTAGDLGTQQEQLDQTFARIGMGDTSFHAAVVRAEDEAEVRARIRQASDTRTEGLKLSELVGGYGVAEAALAALEERHIPADGARAVVQGFGAMGGSTALYLARAGVKIVGITDARGMIRNAARGLDVELLLAARTSSGLIDRSALREDDEEVPGDEWLSQDVDVLVPAAVSYTITADNCDRVRGSLIVEAANVPTTPEAEQRLLERGVTVIPDFIANTGAAAGAWWVILGEVVSPVGACSRLSAQIRPLVAGLMSRAAATGGSVRQTAVLFARENSQRMIRENGGAVAFRDLYTATQPGHDVAAAEVPPLPREVPDVVPAVVLDVRPEAVAVPDADTPPVPLNGSYPEAADLLDGPVDTGFQAPDAVPAYWPGDAGTGTP
ncbi:Glu/Leu/Phe/Val dehydrogenase dimerization domain-containing protein [Streptomyces sp. DSM 42041]|uniref:Glu/Leu/Phe/Val dehydrogenase dimerization domain-containing protein n=1 Tax=Streptomyces hazeniae TaxID=3075538 RepID=A0ABU2NT30_9ACTN|nr:Glu/Leu/Phe/Val dehydrogenase dimerization domain-containing protein [Streptomyces sp. DSM 42041]MDT0379885.1 Glu/Leu/Phe/Val dehydrogenase dimerization domain-containing protein [Streptomyces sp. DSM 42041]